MPLRLFVIRLGVPLREVRVVTGDRVRGKTGDEQIYTPRADAEGGLAAAVRAGPAVRLRPADFYWSCPPRTGEVRRLDEVWEEAPTRCAKVARPPAGLCPTRAVRVLRPQDLGAVKAAGPQKAGVDISSTSNARPVRVEYTSQDGSRRRARLIHRALFGSIERFSGCYRALRRRFPAWWHGVRWSASRSRRAPALSGDVAPAAFARVSGRGGLQRRRWRRSRHHTNSGSVHAVAATQTCRIECLVPGSGSAPRTTGVRGRRFC